MAATTRRSFRTLLLRGASGVIAAGLTLHGALAESQSTSFDITERPLAAALMQFSAQSGNVVVAPSALTRGKAANPVHGDMSPEEALRRMLEGSDLKVGRATNGSLVIVPLTYRKSEHARSLLIYAQNASPSPEPAPAAAAQRETPRARVAAPEAQDEAEPATLGEIVVTARKIEENLQKVPVAVTAFSGSQLQNASIQKFIDLQYQTPSLQVARSPANPNVPFIALRGQVQTNIAASTEPSVGMYLDGVYNNAIFGVLGDELVDVKSVEILKGPQGTLYGRNTTGGAINIFTNQPVDQFEGEVTVGAGNYSRAHADAVVNLPIVAGKAALRLVGSVSDRDGFGVNTVNGGRLGDSNQRSLRGALKLDPTENLEVVVRADVSRSRNSGGAVRPLFVKPGSTAALETTAELFGAAAVTNPVLLAQGLAAYQRQIDASMADPFRVAHDAPETSDTDANGASLTVSYNLDRITFKSITAYRFTNDFRIQDADATNFNLVTAYGRVKFNQWTQEFQVTGHELDDKLKYAAGFYYFAAVARESTTSFVFPVLTHNSFTLTDAQIRERSPAVYGQATYSILPNVNVTGGLRWTKDTKKLIADALSGSSIAPTVCALPATLVLSGPCTAEFSVPSHNVSYTAAVDWSPTPGLLLYGRTSRGFKGGYENQRIIGSPLSAHLVLPEEVTDYEAGVKYQGLDNRLRINADYYHSDYTNIQRTTSIGSGNAFTTVSTNAANAKIDGAEIEAAVLPIAGVTLSATAAYTEPKYINYVDAGFDQSFQKFLNTPKWTYSLSAAYAGELPIGHYHAQLDWFWRSSADMFPGDAPGTVTLIGGVPFRGTGTPDNLRIQQPYGLLNASFSIESTKYDLEARLYIRNIFDKRYVGLVNGIVNGGLFSTAAEGDPRTYGFNITKRF